MMGVVRVVAGRMRERLEAGEEVHIVFVVVGVAVRRAGGRAGREFGGGGGAMARHFLLALDFESRGVHGGKGGHVAPLALHLEHSEHAPAHFLLFLLEVDGVVVVILLLQLGGHLLQLPLRALFGWVDPLQVGVMLFRSPAWALPVECVEDGWDTAHCTL
jgi:hypothetical protein